MILKHKKTLVFGVMFGLLPVTLFVVLTGATGVQEKTVAELQRLRYAEGNRKNLEKISAVPTTVTGRAVLPDGSPATGFKIDGWGRSITHIGQGHVDFDTITDENGCFSLNLYRPCLYWITITDPNEVYVAKDRHFELTEPLEPNALQFQLQEGVPVEGVVIDRDTNKPVAGLPVLLIHKPIHLKELSRDERMNLEKIQQVFKEVRTDETGRFKFAALPLEYMVALDEMFGFQPPSPEDEILYTRRIVVENHPMTVDFKIPSPWHGRLLQKDGTPAAFYSVDLSVRFDQGTAYKELVTDENGQFMIYRPIAIDSISVDTYDQGQWLYRKYEHESLKDDFTFQLYSPLTAKGRLVRKTSGEPLREFAFICDPSEQKNVVTDENGDFKIDGIHLNIETALRFINPLDPNGCIKSDRFKEFTPDTPDALIELGVIELEESEFLDPNLLEKLIGQSITIEGLTPDDRVFEWKSYTGKVVLIDFWAMWCGPCLQEIPNLKAMYERFHDRGFEVVGISLDSDFAALERGMERFQFPWAVLADEKRSKAGQESMYDRFKIRSIPRCILVGRDGKVISVEARGEKLEIELKRLLDK